MRFLSFGLVALSLISQQHVEAGEISRLSRKLTHYAHEIPQCSNPCFVHAATAVCGGFDHFQCQCVPSHESRIQGRVVPCVDRRCNSTDANKVSPLYAHVCRLSRRIKHLKEQEAAGDGSQPSSDHDGASEGGTSDGGLSAGAKAGIGVGVAIAVLAVLGAASVVLFRRRKQKRTAASAASNEGTKVELPANNSAGAMPPAYTYEKGDTDAQGNPVSPTHGAGSPLLNDTPSELPGSGRDERARFSQMYELQANEDPAVEK